MRKICIFSVVIGAFTCGAPAWAQGTQHPLYEAAKKEGKLTWCSSQYSTPTAERMGRVFTEMHPGVSVQVIKATSQVIFQRINEDIKAGIGQCDVFSSTDAGHSAILKRDGHLLQYRPENEAKIVNDLRNIDPDGYYYITSVGLVLITYNTQKVKAEEAPKSWQELLQPKWKKRITMASPAFSGGAGAWAVQMRKMYGPDYAKALLDNEPLLSRSIDNTVTVLNAAEREIAVGWSASSLKNLQKGNPIGISYPSDGAVAVAGASGIMKKSSNVNAAKLFVEFLLSEENSKMITEEAEVPLRPEVTPPKGLKPLAEVKLVRLTPQETVEGIAVVKEEWRNVPAN